MTLICLIQLPQKTALTGERNEQKIIAGGFISNLAFKYFGTYAGLACMLFLAYILIRAARAVDNKFPHLSH